MPLTHTSEESRIIRKLSCKANHNRTLIQKIMALTSMHHYRTIYKLTVQADAISESWL